MVLWTDYINNVFITNSYHVNNGSQVILVNDMDELQVIQIWGFPWYHQNIAKIVDWQRNLRNTALCACNGKRSGQFFCHKSRSMAEDLSQFEGRPEPKWKQGQVNRWHHPWSMVQFTKFNGWNEGWLMELFMDDY